MGNCNGNCGGCSGCARELTLSEAEIDFLRRLGEVAFLPVARQLGDLTPIYPETDAAENMSLILELLEKKGLISLDYDRENGRELMDTLQEIVQCEWNLKKA